MAKTDRSRSQQRIPSDVTVVDVDAHVYESVADIEPYIDDRYDILQKLVRWRRDPMHSIFSVSYTSPSTMDSYSDPDDGDSKVLEMNEFNIDYGVLVPTLFNAIHTVNNPRYACGLANAYNSWILDAFLDKRDELNGVIVVSADKPERAAEEIDDRASEDSFVGVAMAPGGLLPPSGHEKYDPVYQAATDHDLPVVFHGSNGTIQSTMPTQFEWTETYVEGHFYGHPFTIMWHLCTSLFRGVPERFPDLEHVFLEAGLSYIPFVKWRLDDIYLENSDELPYLEALPSEYIDDLCYFATQPVGAHRNPAHLANIIDIAGPGSIMYSSDLPHPTFDPPEEFYSPIQPHFERESLTNMMGETALDVFDIDD